MHSNELENLSLGELRARWAQAWSKTPHKRMGRTMLIKSLRYKVWEADTGGPPEHVQKRLTELIKQYKRKGKTNPGRRLKVGIELVRMYQDKKNVNHILSHSLIPSIGEATYDIAVDEKDAMDSLFYYLNLTP